jgi:hypothetical protein
MKFTTANVIRLVAWSAILVTGGSFLYNLYQKEQMCQSYERQIVVQLNKSMTIVNQLVSVKETTQNNPFLIMMYVPQLMELQNQVLRIRSDSEELKSEYIQFCSDDRYNSFVNTYEVRNLVKRINEKAEVLSNN